MKITNLEIINFRNYERLSVEFNNNINIFIGNNGEGKTNILEAIYVLAITKSHRAYIDKNLITNNKKFTKLSGKIVSLNDVKNMELIINPFGKRVSINKSIVKKISDYISNFLVILFCPDDLEIVKGSPSVRRKYLNIEIGQIDNKYLYYLNEYNELLKNRNSYLKSINVDNINMEYLNILNEQLCNKALLIYKYRFEYINKLNENLKLVCKNITDDSIKLKYINNVDIYEYNDKIKDKLLNKLNNSLKSDILKANTNYGPHKDDIEILFNDKCVRDYGSQGQQRLSILCMKFAEIELIKSKTSEYPVLLLDDVFSELDILKKNAIINYLNENIQVFITSTNINDIDNSILNTSKIFNINDGNIV